MSKLIAGCKAMPGTIEDIPAGEWWYLLHLVAWDCGERTGAMLGLRWDMVDVETGDLVVPAEFRKGGRKPMAYKLKPSTLRELRRILEPQRDEIFPWKRDICSYHLAYRRLLKRAGLPYIPWKSGMQKVRRSFATHLEANGGNATEALAHSERSITKGSYLDVRLIERVQPNSLLFPIGSAM